MGTNELTGWEFLQKNVIAGCSCDLDKEFAFISYAHDEIDTRIVRNVFKRLYDMGWNLWIDTANIPRNEKAWSKAAIKALTSVKNCRMALFFRSEESLIREPILKELKIISNVDHIRRTVVTDIFHKDMSAEDYWSYLANQGGEKFAICDAICDIVSTESSAIRLRTDAENDINKLVEEISKELENENIYRRDVTEKHTISPEDESHEVPVQEAVVVQEPEDIAVQKSGNAQKTESAREDRLWRYTNRKGADAFLVWESELAKNCVVRKGSRVAEEAFSFATSAPAAHKLKQELIQRGILADGIFMEDYPCNKVSTMINLLGGGSINMRDQIKKGVFAPVGKDVEADCGNGGCRLASSEELRELLQSPRCKDENLKRCLRENRVKLRISADDITFREEYMKYDIWLLSFDKSEANADIWDFYILKKGNVNSEYPLCFDAIDSEIFVPIQRSIRKKHLAACHPVQLAGLLDGSYTDCFK